MPLRVEAPNFSQRKDEDDDVRYDVRYSVADEEMLGVDALGFCVYLVPESIDGIARENGDQDDGDPPRNDHGLHDVRRESELRDGKDSAV